jgi:heme-degrading monooxygenase HmoA
MFARLSTYELPQERVNESVETFTRAIDQIRELPGLREAFFLLERDGTRAVTVTVWESEAAMAASRVRASRARSEAATQLGTAVLSTGEYVVGVHALGTADRPGSS